ncbi:hypothetical protein IT568_08485 [bacterium]|nr:hypothetical protein [bacterium]
MLEKYLPVNISTHGGEIDTLLINLHYLMLVLFVGGIIFYLIALVKFRQKEGCKANYTGIKNTKIAVALALVVAVVELVFDVMYSVPIWANVTATFPEPKDALEVRIIAQQFAWNIHYAGPDGKFGKTDPKLIDETDNPLGLDREDANAKDDVTTVNQLHVPINKPVLVYLSTKDVIHSFSLPVMRVKQDAIPGMIIPVTFQATKTGEYQIACAQLCGLGHYRMVGFFTTHTQEDFDNWMSGQVEAAKASDSEW